MIIGSHVSLSAPGMFVKSVKATINNKANALMVYTGAPQNTRRKPIEQLNIPAGQKLMKSNGIQDIIVHAPYIINLANSKKLENFKFAIKFLREEVKRANALGAKQLVLHPGAHVGAGAQTGINSIVKGLNEVLLPNQRVQIAIETMAGKGTEVGKNFHQIADIISGVNMNDKVSVCFDTCHVNDAGYDLVHDLDDTLTEFDKEVGINKLGVIHLNDSKNPMGSHKDRHENIGLGYIGFDTLNLIAHLTEFEKIPKILETPYIKDDLGKKYSPYKYEIAMLKKNKYNEHLKADIITNK